MTTIIDLNEDELWIDAAGHVHFLDRMDPHHRANLIPFLRARACNFRPDMTYGEAQAWIENTPLMRKLVEYEKQRNIDDRRATAMRNAEYEDATGYKAVRP